MPSMIPCNGCGMTVTEPCHLINCPTKRLMRKSLHQIPGKTIFSNYEFEELLPEWAEDKANGNYRHIHCALPTRDGRRTGNAVNAGIYKNATDQHGTIYNVITDAGNIIHCSEREMDELFYPPEYVMREMLPMHDKALRAQYLGVEISDLPEPNCQECNDTGYIDGENND